MFGLGRGQIVQHGVNLPRPLGAGHQAFQKGDERLTGVPLGGHAVHPCRFVRPRRIQRQGAMAIIFEAVTLGPPRRERQ